MRPFEDEVDEIMVHYHDVARAHGMDRALREAVESNVFTRRECAGLQRRVKELEAAIHAECCRCAMHNKDLGRAEDCRCDTCPLWPHRPGRREEAKP